MANTLPTIGDTVRIYSRHTWNERTETGRIVLRRARTGPSTEKYVIVRENRHGDWTVSPIGVPGCTHDVFRVDVEKA